MTATYAADEQWATESRPRHRQGIRMLVDAERWDSMVDLGCGRMSIGSAVFSPYLYSTHGAILRIDADPEAQADLTANYREVTKFDLPGRMAAVSFFSTELTAGYLTNQALYAMLFTDNPNLTDIFAVGIFYERQKKVYQSTGPVGPTESRVLLPAGSKMYGPDVVEVYRRIRRPVGL